VANILVVDDEYGVREGCRRVLALEGHSVQAAESAEPALSFLEQQRGEVDLVLLDVKMPGMSGLDMLNAIQQLDADVVTVMVTGYATLETAIEATKRGAYDFLPKPFTPDELLGKVAKALERRALLREARQLREEREHRLLEIATEKSRLRTIINCMADGVLVTNREGEIVLYNPAALNVLDADASSCLGRPARDCIRNEDLLDLIDAALAQSEPSYHMVGQEITIGQGPPRVLMANVAPVRDDPGQLLGAVVVLRDISRLKELERAKSQFVRMVSHELRAPLGAIHGYLDLVLSSSLASEHTNEAAMLSRARDRAEALLSLVDDLLNLSALEAGAVARHLEPLALGTLVEECWELLRIKAEERKVTMTQCVEPNLPAVIADREEMLRVLTNVLSNAIKYNRYGGAITVSLRREGPYVRLEVADTGIGIPKAAQEHLFDEFYRVKSRETREITGTGLGLSIVKRTVEAYGGRVEVVSEPGVGSTFSVIIPAQQ